MTLCTFVLVASEFMPVSLLSPIAADLRASTGQRGQAIAISGLFAMIASLTLGRLINGIDRRLVLLGLTALLIVSGAVVAGAPGYAMLMLGRAVLGIAIGGFWSMSAAIAMRLVPAESVPKALAMLNGGNALATVIGAPLGSFLGGLIGWRGAFFCVVPIAIAATAWQALALPSLPAERRVGGSGMLVLLQRRTVLLGLAGAVLLFMGQFALYTYLRPFLEQVTRVGLGTLSTLLLVVGVAGFIGTTLIGRLIGHRLHLLLGNPGDHGHRRGRPGGLRDVGRHRRGPARRVGLRRHRGTGRMVDLVDPRRPRPSRSRRRTDGRGGPVRDHVRGDHRRPGV